MHFQLSDPGHRRRVVRTLSAATVIVLIVIVAFQFWLHAVSLRLDAVHLVALIKPMLGVCVLAIAACTVALGVHLVVRGKRIVRDQRYPPRDARVIRDTLVREGAAAVRIGKAGQITGLALCALSPAIAILGLLWVSRIG